MSSGIKRSIYKSISWHILHTAIIAVTVYFMTGRLDLTGGIVSIHVISETIIYYIHERIWERRTISKN
jgi:uncharacterized membrane protein